MPQYTAPKKRPAWLIPLVIAIVVIVVVAVAAVAFLAIGPSKTADLRAHDMHYEFDFWGDTVTVWASVTNDGDAAAYNPIELSFNVYVDGVPSLCYGEMDESAILPGETADGQWAFTTSYQSTDSVCDVAFVQITWHE
jgi:hypothetical protein